MSKKQITLTFTVETNRPGVIDNLQVAPIDCGIAQHDILDMLATSVGFQNYCVKSRNNTQGLIVSGSRTINDRALVCKVLDTCIGTTPNVDFILNNTPGPTWYAQDYANERKINVIKLSPSWEKSRKWAGGVCALDMIDKLCNYSDKKVVLIWDEETTEVPYFFKPALERGIDLFVYSTVQNKWLNVEELRSTMKEFTDRYHSVYYYYKKIHDKKFGE